MQLPLVLALVICDDVWIDRNSGKWSIQGVFSTLVVSKTSQKIARLTVYACITECPSEANIRVRIVDVNEERSSIAELTDIVHSTDPRAVLQGHFRFDELEFERPGEYRIQFWACSELLLERRLTVLHS